jgi:pseudouridine 5'-phosphatase
MTASHRPIRAVVFDLDGLMFNTEELYVEVGSQLLGRRGNQISKPLLDAMMGRPSPVALQIMIDWHRLDATVDQLQQETEELFPELLRRSLQPMPGLFALLEALEAAQLPKAVATSSRRIFAHSILGQFSLLSRFQFVLTCEDVVEGKPHPEIYLRAARQLEVAAAEMLVLEDSQNGCQAAVAAGAFAVAVPGPHSRNHTFPGAAFIADGLSDARIAAVTAAR